MMLELDTPVDWRALILDLVRMGWKLNGIAECINVPKSTLGGWWYDGAEPRFEHGRALIKLHAIEAAKHAPKSRQR